MNFQDVIRESYDEANKALKVNTVAGGSSGGGLATVYPQGKYNSTLPTLNDGDRGDIQLDDHGYLRVRLGNNGVDVNSSEPGDNNANTGGLVVVPENLVYDGANWDRMRGDSTNGVLVNLGANNGVSLNEGLNNIGFATVYVSTPTLYAVVNTGAAGDPKTYIGLVTATLDNSRGVGIVGNVTLSDSKGYIGLVTVTQASTARTITGNLTLSDPKNFIGLVTVVQSSSARTITGNVTLSDPKTYIGLTTVTLDNSRGVGVVGNITLSDPKNYIGLVTATALNAGTSKTLVHVPIGLGNNSLSTIAVPTNANKIKVTSLIINSNITTEIALKSGVTYLTGNASLGVTLFPGGGFVLPGAPDTPQWLSLPSGALVVEKRDPGGTVSKVAGHAIYFDEI
jgi:hypothetical protein